MTASTTARQRRVLPLPEPDEPQEAFVLGLRRMVGDNYPAVYEGILRRHYAIQADEKLLRNYWAQLVASFGERRASEMLREATDLRRLRARETGGDPATHPTANALAAHYQLAGFVKQPA